MADESIKGRNMMIFALLAMLVTALVYPVSATVTGRARVPRKAVMFFDRTACPSGWSAFDPAEGRVLVGTPDEGTRRGRVGVALADQQRVTHRHQVDATTQDAGGSHRHFVDPAGFEAGGGFHSHQLSPTAPPNSTKQVQGGLGASVAEPDHLHAVNETGTGAFHAHDVDVPRTASEFTQDSHSHMLNDSTAQGRSHLPYLQLTACSKD